MNLIVAVDNNWGIGGNGDLLVRLKKDLEYFKEMTKGKVVILGRETLKTFPRQMPLRNRTNIILSRDKNYKVEDAITVNSLDGLFETLKEHNSDEVFVIGGQSIYEQLLPHTKLAYVTKINQSYEADRYFPNLDLMSNWEQIEFKDKVIEDGVEYNFTVYRNNIII